MKFRKRNVSSFRKNRTQSIVPNFIYFHGLLFLILFLCYLGVTFFTTWRNRNIRKRRGRVKRRRKGGTLKGWSYYKHEAEERKKLISVLKSRHHDTIHLHQLSCPEPFCELYNRVTAEVNCLLFPEALENAAASLSPLAFTVPMSDSPFTPSPPFSVAPPEDLIPSSQIVPSPPPSILSPNPIIPLDDCLSPLPLGYALPTEAFFPLHSEFPVDHSSFQPLAFPPLPPYGTQRVALVLQPEGPLSLNTIFSNDTILPQDINTFTNLSRAMNLTDSYVHHHAPATLSVSPPPDCTLTVTRPRSFSILLKLVSENSSSDSPRGLYTYVLAIRAIDHSRLSVSEFSWWQAHANDLSPSTLPTCHFNQELLTLDSSEASFGTDPAGSLVEPDNLSLLSPEVQAVLERRIKKRIDFRVCKEKVKKGHFSPKQLRPDYQLNTSGKILESISDKHDSAISLPFWSSEGKPKELKMHQQSPYSKTLEDDLQQKCIQLFGGLPSLHSESLPSAVHVSSDCSPVFFSNRILNVSTGPECLALAQPLSLSLTEIQPSSLPPTLVQYQPPDPPIQSQGFKPTTGHSKSFQGTRHSVPYLGHPLPATSPEGKERPGATRQSPCEIIHDLVEDVQKTKASRVTLWPVKHGNTGQPSGRPSIPVSRSTPKLSARQAGVRYEPNSQSVSSRDRVKMLQDEKSEKKLVTLYEANTCRNIFRADELDAAQSKASDVLATSKPESTQMIHANENPVEAAVTTECHPQNHLILCDSKLLDLKQQLLNELKLELERRKQIQAQRQRTDLLIADSLTCESKPESTQMIHANENQVETAVTTECHPQNHLILCDSKLVDLKQQLLNELKLEFERKKQIQAQHQRTDLLISESLTCKTSLTHAQGISGGDMRAPSVFDELDAVQSKASGILANLEDSGISTEEQQEPWVSKHDFRKCQDKNLPPSVERESPAGPRAEESGGEDAGLETFQPRSKSFPTQKVAVEETLGSNTSQTRLQKEQLPESSSRKQMRRFLQWISPGKNGERQEISLEKGSSSSAQSRVKSRIAFTRPNEPWKFMTRIGKFLEERMGHKKAKDSTCPQQPPSPPVKIGDPQQTAEVQAQAEPIIQGRVQHKVPSSKVTDTKACHHKIVFAGQNYPTSVRQVRDTETQPQKVVASKIKDQLCEKRPPTMPRRMPMTYLCCIYRSQTNHASPNTLTTAKGTAFADRCRLFKQRLFSQSHQWEKLSNTE